MIQPITVVLLLIVILGKLFTKVLNTIDLEILCIIGDEQIGFTRGKRTTDHMFILKTLMEKHTTKGAI